jgi:hypothetical protein
VIVDESIKGPIPNATWEQVRTRINELFRNAGGLQAIYVSTKKNLPQVNLTDGVVECFLDSIQASSGFRNHVSESLSNLGHKFLELRALAKTFDQPTHYSIDAGRSFTVKGTFQIPLPMPLMPQLVCITYGVVAVKSAFSVWSGLLVKKTETTLETIRSAPQAEQLGFGITLGNLIAHELRHQLALSRTGQGMVPLHSGSGLGADGADFNNPSIKFSDDETIRASIARLQLVQSQFEFNRS